MFYNVYCIVYVVNLCISLMLYRFVINYILWAVCLRIKTIIITIIQHSVFHCWTNVDHLLGQRLSMFELTLVHCWANADILLDNVCPCVHNIYFLSNIYELYFTSLKTIKGVNPCMFQVLFWGGGLCMVIIYIYFFTVCFFQMFHPR